MRKVLIAAAFAFITLMPPLAVQADDWVIDTIYERAAAYGVSGDRLVCIARYETGGRFNANAIGDGGSSFGIFQLHRGGLLDQGPSSFYARGYSDPFNVWEAADYTAWAWAQGYQLQRHWSTLRYC